MPKCETRVKAVYTHGPGTDEPLILERDTDSNGTLDQRAYYHTDGLGSIKLLTDDTGNAVQEYLYDSFGNIVSTTGTVENPYTYTGREYDSESGLFYYRARYYDAGIGRFISEDPIGFSGGDVNLYAYVANDPVNFVDQSGKNPVILFCLLNPGICTAVGTTVVIYVAEKVTGDNYSDFIPGQSLPTLLEYAIGKILPIALDSVREWHQKVVPVGSIPDPFLYNPNLFSPSSAPSKPGLTPGDSGCRDRLPPVSMFKKREVAKKLK